MISFGASAYKLCNWGSNGGIFVFCFPEKRLMMVKQEICLVIHVVKRARWTNYGDGMDAHLRKEGVIKTIFCISMIDWATFISSILRGLLLTEEFLSWIRYFFLVSSVYNASLLVALCCFLLINLLYILFSLHEDRSIKELIGVIIASVDWLE